MIAQTAKTPLRYKQRLVTHLCNGKSSCIETLSGCMTSAAALTEQQQQQQQQQLTAARCKILWLNRAADMLIVSCRSVFIAVFAVVLHCYAVS
jgi:hypothetical protein